MSSPWKQLSRAEGCCPPYQGGICLRTGQICRKALLALTLLGTLAGCGAPSGSSSSGGGEGDLILLTIGTADSGGTMYQAGSALAQAITQEDNSIKVNISASTGSGMNVRSLESGEVDLALISGDMAYAAVNGEDEFQPPVELRAIAAVYSSVSNWVAPASSGYTYVHDLTEARIGVGPQGSTTELSARVAVAALSLEEQGTTLVNCGLGDGAEMLGKGELDAVHAFTGMPVSSLVSLAEKLPCRVLLYTPEELATILEEHLVYYPAQIPAGTYPGQSEVVDTFGVKCLLCVSNSMPEELAYQLTRAIWNASGRMGDYSPAMDDMAQPDFLCLRPHGGLLPRHGRHGPAGLSLSGSAHPSPSRRGALLPGGRRPVIRH